ncbi:succinate dehydrogenase, cytochrome b556 subunit [Limnochorda pilosa]|uniref:Succinate dehydrogenase n=1 Tax=Limnochorda pilosa TaxID=1555112 RepID=A0A0K2SJH9_LIMPI|nr:succinate dehydrogenase, cytochrome b556 subunit [Limnochorda pilosa]BAS27014.1 succinate dehydrogenase [Limnochorda pilosa]
MYRGGQGMWSWILHRVTGVGVMFFLVFHILDTWLVGFGPELYNDVMAIYNHPVFRLGEVGLVGALLFHGLNGVRIVLVDFWPQASLFQKQRQLFYVVVGLFVVLYVPTAWYMIAEILH